MPSQTDVSCAASVTITAAMIDRNFVLQQQEIELLRHGRLLSPPNNQ